MTKKIPETHETGLTLVEILASLVILGIVFVAFMTIFPQMTLFNNWTETKLETMNEARVVLEELKREPISSPEIDRAVCPAPANTSDKDQWFTYQDTTSSKGIRKTVLVKKCPDVKPANKEAKNVVQLHQVRILLKKKSDVISESFGYVQVEL